MKLSRLVQWMDENSNDADSWPVMFTSFAQNEDGEWDEIADREPITAVQVEVDDKEVLLITDPDKPVLSVASFREQISELAADYGDFAVETCEPPIMLEMDGGQRAIRIDIPICGMGRHDDGKCILVLFLRQADEGTE